MQSWSLDLLQRHAQSPSLRIAEKQRGGDSDSSSDSQLEMPCNAPHAPVDKDSSGSSSDSADQASQSQAASTKNKTNGEVEQDLPSWKWWTGLIIFAATNVGFLRLFEFCAGVVDYAWLSCGFQARIWIKQF